MNSPFIAQALKRRRILLRLPHQRRSASTSTSTSTNNNRKSKLRTRQVASTLLDNSSNSNSTSTSNDISISNMRGLLNCIPSTFVCFAGCRRSFSSGPPSSSPSSSSSLSPASASTTSIFMQASASAVEFDTKFESTTASTKLPPLLQNRDPVLPHAWSAPKSVPSHIVRPPYAETGMVPYNIYHETVCLHSAESIPKMRKAARLARKVLDHACSLAEVGVTTDQIDTAVHQMIIAHGAYPSPLNYSGFPKSVCSSVNEVICHGIPDARPLQFGDVVSFDVSCYLDGVHGDNCATVIVGDSQPKPGKAGTDWRNVPYLETFQNPLQQASFVSSRRLVQATRESMYAAIAVCKPGACLTHVGAAIQDVADAYGYQSVEKYRGHGIGTVFHCAPFVKHYRNTDYLELKPGMVFTIEPMIVEGSQECFEWDDDWTVATVDGGLAAQFEHMVLITDTGHEILTVPEWIDDAPHWCMDIE